MKRNTHRGLYAPELLEARIAPATIIVTSLADAGAGSLRQAVIDANDPALHPGADTISFAATILPGLIELTTGEIAITDTLTIKGPGVDLLSISGKDASRIFKIDDTTAAFKPATLSGLTLTDGKTAGDGGAVYSLEPLTLKNVVVRSSEAGAVGGGVFVETDGKVSISNCRIVHNEAGGRGGLSLDGDAGVFVIKTTIANNSAVQTGGMHATADGVGAVLVIDKSVIANNTATASWGGLRLNYGKITVKNSLVTGNDGGDSGGGLYLNNGELTVSKTTFSNNTAGRGGAIGSQFGASIVIAGSRFVGNSTTDATKLGGGALYLNGPIPVKVTGSLFSANTSVTVGGAFTIDGGATLTMKGSTVSGNSAPTSGGALFFQDGTLVLSGNKFTENRADYGGALMIQTVGGGGPVTSALSGNLFQANVAGKYGGAIFAQDAAAFSSKADKFIGNVAITDQGGGVNLRNFGGIFITGSLFQSNVSGNSGGGLVISENATLTGLKVLDNIAGGGARGGGLRITGGVVVLSKSVVTGNVASDGGGIFYNTTTAIIDAATRAATRGNVAFTNTNIGSGV